MRHDDVILLLQWHHRLTCDHRVAVSFFYLSHRLVWVCEIEISHMGKIKGNPNLEYEKIVAYPSFLKFVLGAQKTISF